MFFCRYSCTYIIINKPHVVSQPVTRLCEQHSLTHSPPRVYVVRGEGGGEGGSPRLVCWMRSSIICFITTLDGNKRDRYALMFMHYERSLHFYPESGTSTYIFTKQPSTAASGKKKQPPRTLTPIIIIIIAHPPRLSQSGGGGAGGGLSCWVVVLIRTTYYSYNTGRWPRSPPP